jgi:hypothetical protein
MDAQYLIVALIVLAAAAYVGLVVRRQTRSFSTKKDCGSNCGCSSKAKEATIER